MAKKDRSNEENVAAEILGATVDETWEDATPAGKELVSSTFSDEDLRGITTFADAVALATDQFQEIDTISETLGTGFQVLSKDDKESLVGIPFLILSFRFVPGDFGEPYVSMVVVTRPAKDGSVKKYILNDGGTGIRAQLEAYQQLPGKEGKSGGLYVDKGLRVSRYHTDPKTGVPLDIKDVGRLIASGVTPGRGTTYYLDTSA